MKKLLAFAMAALLGGCVTERVHTSYDGPDAGALVFSAGNIGTQAGFMLFYRVPGQPSGMRGFGGDGLISYNPGSILGRDPDFTGHETGEVTVQHLKPGNYEIYTVQYFAGGTQFDLSKDISVPFTIEAGKTTYIGDFATIGYTGKNLFGMTVPAGGVFVISDKHERDIPIAQKQDPKLPPVTVAVIDTGKIRSPIFVSREPN